MKLPNAERAVAEVEKLRDYSLNPVHPSGKHKARVFRAALGFTQADAGLLRLLVLEAARVEEARAGKLLSYGQMYELSFEVAGLHGRVTIQTAWIVATGTDFPRLVTCYVKGR